MAENENNEKSSFDYLQEKFADKPKVTEPTSPNAFDIKDLSEDEALEMYLKQPDEVVYMMTGHTKDELKAMAAERALNAENGEKLIEENNTEKQNPAPTLQVESIDVDTKYIEENIEKVNKAKSERQEETFVQSSSNLTNNHEGRDGNERNDDGDER